MRTLALSAAVGLIAASASAQVLENFEHGNVGLYTPVAGAPNMSIIAGAAHDGALGARFDDTPAANAFFYRTDIATSPGNTYYAFVRTNGGDGRLYLGVGASAGGAVSAVAAANTSQLILQNNAGFGFIDLQSVGFAFTPGTWYRLGMQWDASGDIKAMLWDEAGTPLAQTPTSNLSQAAGGLSLRAFGAGGWDCDTFTRGNPVGGCLADLTTGAVAGQAGYGVPNGILNNDDFFYYLAQFAAGNLARCDFTTGAVPGLPGYGVPNGILNNDDFFYYLAIFAAGC